MFLKDCLVHGWAVLCAVRVRNMLQPLSKVFCCRHHSCAVISIVLCTAAYSLNISDYSATVVPSITLLGVAAYARMYTHV